MGANLASYNIVGKALVKALRTSNNYVSYELIHFPNHLISIVSLALYCLPVRYDPPTIYYFIKHYLFIYNSLKFHKVPSL
jgi:hypothetical protein